MYPIMKSTTTITVDSEVLLEIKGCGVNVSELCNQAFKDYLGQGEPQAKKLLMEKMQLEQIKLAVLKTKLKETEEKEQEANEQIELKKNQCALCGNDTGEHSKKIGSNKVCHSCFLNMTTVQLDALRG